MNDTHGVEGKGWYGFDLDGTLAKYDKWEGISHIGEPVKPMVDLIKRMHDEGKVVKILTARVAPRTLEDGTVGIQKAMVPVVNLNEYLKEPKNPFTAELLTGNRNMIELNAKQIIEFWCEEYLGFVPEITHEKDHLMLELYDDRVKQVVPNEGLLVEDLYRECGKMLQQVHADNNWLLYKLSNKFTGFLAGLWTGATLAMLTVAGVEAYDKWYDREKEPARARFEAAHKVLCDLVNDWPEDAR